MMHVISASTYRASTISQAHLKHFIKNIKSIKQLNHLMCMYSHIFTFIYPIVILHFTVF